MRITNIRISQKANLGNYESFDFGADAVIGEEDDINGSTQTLVDFVDWHAQRSARENKARAHRKILAEATTAGTESTHPAALEAAAWLKKYEERKAKVESM